MPDQPTRPLWTETTPNPSVRQLVPSGSEPTRRFERAFALTLITLAACLVARAFF